MWLKAIRLENIKCFENTEESLVFTRSGKRRSDKPFLWVTLLGENGVGKSTILQTMGLLLAGPESAKELLPRPDGWVRDSASHGKITAYIHQNDGDEGEFGDEKIRRNFSYSYIVTSDVPTKVKVPGRKEIKSETFTEPTLIEDVSKMLSWLRTNAFPSNARGWFATGYGAFRRLTRERRMLIPSLNAPNRASNFVTQFNEDEPLNSFERWMVYLDFRSAKDPNDDLAKRMREIGGNVIEKLLPGDVTISEVTKEGLIVFNLNGTPIPTVSMSDGYRSIIALAGDIVWRLIQTFPDMSDPTQAHGVVLIDELDIHLHPVWQRTIAGWLRNTFPNMQFIVATHSPFIAIGAGENALTLKLAMNQESGVVEISRIKDLHAYDVERALTSDAFGIVSTYSPQAQEKIERYHQLAMRLDELDSEERREHKELADFAEKALPLNSYSLKTKLESEMDEFLSTKEQR